MHQIYARQLTPPSHERPASTDQGRFGQSYLAPDAHKLASRQKLHSVVDVEARNTSLPPSPVSDRSTQYRGSPPLTVASMYQARPEQNPRTSREQLPPLSSLFGAGPSQARSTRSPLLGHQSPDHSSHNGRHHGLAVHPERSLDGPHFPRPTMQRHSTPARPDENLGFASLPRHIQAGQRSASPRFDSRFNPIENTRLRSPTTAGAWSPRQENNRIEHFSRDTSSSFRPQLNQFQLQRSQDARLETDPTNSELRATPAQSFPPSVAATDPPPTKDGLGPKIWTGTQFLPRFVRRADVPGEGPCFFYDDGTHCKTMIDGEQVNAHWGVTKAGKPRKRLAIACITCREKKIKCDPDFPRCIQCEKFGRICKFKNAPRGGQGSSPDTPPVDPEDLVPRLGSGNEFFKVEEQDDTRTTSPQPKVRRESPESESQYPKRQRNGPNHFTPVASESSPRVSATETASPSAPWAEPLTSRTIDHTLLRDWQVDPSISHPTLAANLLNIFFQASPDSAFLMFPEGVFRAWVFSAQEKSLDDLMLLYSVLAFSTAFSSAPDHKAVGIQYAAISRYACNNRHISLQLVQSRLLLAFYYHTTGNTDDCWDFSGGAMTAASGLKLNLELEKNDESPLRSYPYGLNGHGYAECKRRTFWSCYLMDRFNGFCSGHLSKFNAEDIFLRLPCDARSFEAQLDTRNPFFEASTPPIRSDSWEVGSMGYLINITTIWGDIMAYVYRSSQRPASCDASKFVDFYQASTARLVAWKQALPQRYAFSPDTIARTAESGSLGIYVCMHTIYNSSMVELNRYVPSALGTLQKAHHISAAQRHAQMILEMMEQVSTRRGTAAAMTFFSPLNGFAVVGAIDVLSAKVHSKDIPQLLASFRSAQAYLAESNWQSAKTQLALVQQRVHNLTELSFSAGGSKQFAFAGEVTPGLFAMKEPLEKTFARVFDVIYA